MTGADAFLETLATSGLPPLRGGRRGGDDFRADVVTRDLGPLRLAQLVTPEGECFRDARSARAADNELWQIELVTRGWVRAEQGGSIAVLGPAGLVLIDPVRPVRFASTASTHVTMLVPRRSLRLGPDDAARLAGVRIRGDRGPGALVSSLARDMARSLDGFRADEADRSAAAVIELIAVALSAQLGNSRPVADEALRNRIVGFIEARLSDRDLTPAKVAASRVGMVMPGEEEPLSSRYFLQLLAVVWQNDRWEVATLQNARLISLETAMALDAQAAAK